MFAIWADDSRTYGPFPTEEDAREYARTTLHDSWPSVYPLVLITANLPAHVVAQASGRPLSADAQFMALGQ
jgi:hypothetical protein